MPRYIFHYGCAALLELDILAVLSHLDIDLAALDSEEHARVRAGEAISRHVSSEVSDEMDRLRLLRSRIVSAWLDRRQDKAGAICRIVFVPKAQRIAP